MWLRNWDNYNTMKMCGITNTGETGYEDGSLQMKTVAGTVQTDSTIVGTGNLVYLRAHVIAGMIGTPVLQTTTIATTSGNLGQRFFMLPGSGTGAESYDDYALTDIATQTHVSYSYSATPSYDADTDKWTFTVTRTLQNGSGSQITVAEVGIVCALSGTSNYLIARKLLAAPFNVANGANYQISFEFEVQAQSH